MFGIYYEQQCNKNATYYSNAIGKVDGAQVDEYESVNRS